MIGKRKIEGTERVGHEGGKERRKALKGRKVIKTRKMKGTEMKRKRKEKVKDWEMKGNKKERH